MKSILVLLLFLITAAFPSGGQTVELTNEQIQEVQKIIAVFGTKDKAKIAGCTHYPLKRDYPLSDVKDSNDFMKRFDEIFDTAFVNDVAGSKLADWSAVGWRGVMFGRGSIWLNGKGKIAALNHQSPKEKTFLAAAIRSNKVELPEMLRNFEKPEYLILTKNYKIRIDQMAGRSYRYASWKIKSMEKNPDLVVENGVLEFQGSGENYIVTFSSGNYQYVVFINMLGSQKDPDAVLEVKKQGQTVLKEKGEIKRN